MKSVQLVQIHSGMELKTTEKATQTKLKGIHTRAQRLVASRGYKWSFIVLSDHLYSFVPPWNPEMIANVSHHREESQPRTLTPKKAASKPLPLTFNTETIGCSRHDRPIYYHFDDYSCPCPSSSSGNDLIWPSESISKSHDYLLKWRSSSWMSLPKTCTRWLTGWRQLTRVAEPFSQNQGLVSPSRLECLPCSPKKRLKLRGNAQVDCSVQSVVSVVNSSNFLTVLAHLRILFMWALVFFTLPFLFYKCGNVSIVKFSVNLVFRLACFAVVFSCFSFAQQVCSVCQKD